MKGLLNAVFAMLGSGLSQDRELARTVSPAAGWTALLIERDRGVGMPVARHLRLKRDGWPLWSTVFVMKGQPEIAFHWESEERLVVEAPDGRVFKRLDRVDEVEVVYSLPGPPARQS